MPLIKSSSSFITQSLENHPELRRRSMQGTFADAPKGIQKQLSFSSSSSQHEDSQAPMAGDLPIEDGPPQEGDDQMLVDLFDDETEGMEKSKGGSLDRRGNPRLWIGGRPLEMHVPGLTGTAGGKGSNRLLPGEKRHNLNIEPEDQLAMARWLKEEKKSYPESQKGLEDFWKMAVGKYPGCHKGRLKKIMKSEEEMKRRVQTFKKGHLRDNIPKNCLPTSKGIRKEGGG